ncbi:hypothetical protein BC833DRAFT_578694 [Globomyces pollinis-pini]|nr:hypothetical protein BC833DRAFT_578694 [Globomyces pollinis-pini]
MSKLKTPSSGKHPKSAGTTKPKPPESAKSNVKFKTVAHLVARYVVTDTFEIEPKFLYQPAECDKIIQSIKYRDKETLENMIKLHMYLPPQDPKLKKRQEDYDSLSEIIMGYFIEAAEFGYQLGFRPFQMSAWLTIFGFTHSETTVGLLKNKSFNEAIWCQIFQKNFQDITSMEEPKFSGPLFSLSESKKMITFMITGFGQNVQLFKLLILKPQDYEIVRVKKWLEIKTTPVERLSMGVPAEKWKDHCRIEEELAVQRKRSQEQLQEVQRLKEIERAENEAAAAHTALLKAKYLEAERAILLPLPPYPIPPPAFPTMSTIFRKPKDIVNADNSLIGKSHLDTFKPLTELSISERVTKGRNSVLSFEQFKPMTAEKHNSLSEVPAVVVEKPHSKKGEKGVHVKQEVGQLLPPPDIRFSKPLERVARKASIPSVFLEEAASVVQPVIEYEPIKLDQPLSRVEAKNIVTNNFSLLAEEWKKWLQGLLEYESSAWSERFETLAKAKEARDEDVQQTLQKEAMKQQHASKEEIMAKPGQKKSAGKEKKSPKK